MIHLIIAGILVIISTFLIRTSLRSIDLLPAQASYQAVPIDWLFGIHIDLIAFFFSVIVVFMLYSILIFRRRKGEEGDGEHFEGNTRLEILWTVIPLAIVLYLAVIGAQALTEVERRAPDALEVNVVAQQWSWSFEYPDSGVTSAELVLPKDQQVVLRLSSQDVIHSFWVPEFRVKQDALPGGEDFVRELRITPSQEGKFKVRCAELCGEQHYSMLADVEVMASEDFHAWLERQAGECELGPVACGERWASEFGCLACHSTDGSEGVGPTWLGVFGSEEQLDDGSTVVVDEEYLLESILDPDVKVVAGFEPGQMPQNFGERLQESQLEEIIAFIQSLQ